MSYDRQILMGLWPVLCWVNIFPFKLLVDMLNYSITLDVNSRITKALAQETDDRLQVFITENLFNVDSKVI